VGFLAGSAGAVRLAFGFRLGAAFLAAGAAFLAAQARFLVFAFLTELAFALRPVGFLPEAVFFVADADLRFRFAGAAFPEAVEAAFRRLPAAVEVFFFDEEGPVLTRIGGRGGGPGEFIHISAFGWFPGDSSFVWDYPAGRVSIFSNLGDLGRSVNLRQIAPADYGPHGALSGGELVLASGRAMVGGGSAAADSTQVLVIEPGVESVDTLGRFPKRDMGQPAGSLIFSAPVILRARGSLIVWGQATEFRLLLFSGTEAEPFQAEIQHEPMMVRREDHERYKKHFVENLRGQRTDLPALRRQAEAALEGSTYAERLPAFRNILISDDQLVWVEEYRFPWVATRLWQVFNAEGTWISRMEVPLGFRLLDVGEDWALGLTRGPFDEEVIEVRKVVRDRR